LSVPTVATSLAGIDAVSAFPFTNDVVRFDPFTVTVEPETKFVPDNASVKPACPGTTAFGEIAEICGAGFCWITGFTVTAAVADFVASCTEAAVTVTFVAVATDAGAVYKPEAETDPPPDALHATAGFGLLFPFTVAENCWVPPAEIVAVAGEIVTEVTVDDTGFTVTVAEALVLPPAPETVIVYVVVTVGVTDCEPFTASDPENPPEPVADVAFVEDHVIVDDPPAVIEAGFADIVIVGIAGGGLPPPLLLPPPPQAERVISEQRSTARSRAIVRLCRRGFKSPSRPRASRRMTTRF